MRVSPLTHRNKPESSEGPAKGSSAKPKKSPKEARTDQARQTLERGEVAKEKLGAWSKFRGDTVGVRQQLRANRDGYAIQFASLKPSSPSFAAREMQGPVANPQAPQSAPEKPLFFDIADPAPMTKDVGEDGNPKTARFTGPLFVDGVDMNDVRQGRVGDCYMAAAVASIAQTRPHVLEQMIQDNADGTYTVTFPVESATQPGTFTQKEVTVDADLYLRKGKPLYSSPAAKERSPEKMELWFAILEKAYAAHKGGSYEKIGNGGWAGDALRELIGADVSYTRPADADQDKLFARLQRAQEERRPVAASTYIPEDPEGARFNDSGMVAAHAYSIVGTEVKDGKQMVQIRNPWTHFEPGDDGNNDGLFWLEMDKFSHFFKDLYITEKDLYLNQ